METETESVILIAAVIAACFSVSGLGIAIFIAITGSQQHNRIEGKVDNIMDHLGIKSED